MPLLVAKPTYKAPRFSAQARNHKFQIFSAPVNGLDSSQPLAAQDPRSALVATNCFLRRYGLETRPGYRRHTTNLGGVGTEAEVRSLMAYQPPRGPGSTQLAKLWAGCSDQKIYDVSSQTNEATVPTAAVTVAGTQTEPGIWSWTNFATANTNYLCAVCSNSGVNSYWTYDHVGGWVNRTAAITGTAGVVNSFDFIMVWKNRLWFIPENSTQAWYLPVGAITGAAAMFDFGPLLVYGGELRAMASWTLDAGDGIDDKLVVTGSQGDVLVYGGTDPTSISTFGIIGRWFVGPTPAGRRFLSKYGGDLGVLCENGVEYMSRLVVAHGLLDPDTHADDLPSRRYNEVIGADIRDTRGQNGWAMVHIPNEQSVVLVTPHNEPGESKQYDFSTTPVGWTVFEGMPMVCAEVFDGDLYFGTLDGKVGKAFSANTDDQLTNGTPGLDVECAIQTAFVSPEDDRMNLKRPQLVMPMFQSSEPPSVKVQINTEWNGAAVSGSPAFVPSDDALWDQALWNQAVWGGGANSYFVWVGATGLGAFMSLRLGLVAAPRTIFTSWKVVYEPGGIM